MTPLCPTGPGHPRFVRSRSTAALLGEAGRELAAGPRPAPRWAHGRHDNRHYHAVVSEPTQPRPWRSRINVNLSPGVAEELSKLVGRARYSFRHETLTAYLAEQIRLESFLELQSSQENRLLLIVDGFDVTLTPAGSSPGAATVPVPMSPLPVWATPQAVALAAWLTGLLTLIAVILAVAAQAGDHQSPAPVQVHIEIVSPSNTAPVSPQNPRPRLHSGH